MDFSNSVRPALLARLKMCRTDERLLWALGRGLFYYDVEGLDPLGNPRKSALARGTSAVGKGIGGALLVGAATLLFGVGDEGSSGGEPTFPDFLVFGPGPGCLAQQAMSQIGVNPGEQEGRVWVLTSSRLAVFGVQPDPESEPEEKPQNGSLLGKAVGFGKGVLDFGKEVVDTFASSKPERHDHDVEAQPISTRDYFLSYEFPRERITSIEVTTRRVERHNLLCIRVTLVDGSGFDFLIGYNDPVMGARITELTNGMA